MSTQNAPSGFGPNDWLVAEMYERFLDDPGSVDTAWHEFFADYSPDKGGPSRPTDDQRTVLPLGGNGAAAPATAADSEASATAAPP